MKGKSGELNGFLDRGASFKGEMEFEDTMRIDGFISLRRFELGCRHHVPQIRPT